MKKYIKTVFFIVLTFFVFVGLLHVFGITKLLLDFARNMTGGRVNIVIFRVFASLFVLTIIGFSCIKASSIARQKNRNPIAWIIICLFINVWGVILLAYLPSRKVRKRG